MYDKKIKTKQNRCLNPSVEAQMKPRMKPVWQEPTEFINERKHTFPSTLAVKNCEAYNVHVPKM